LTNYLHEILNWVGVGGEWSSSFRDERHWIPLIPAMQLLPIAYR
jgi:hypothetical protein